MQDLAPDVARLPVLFVNVYFVGDPGADEPWTLIDAGLPGSANTIRRAAAARFGADRPPAAIYLTHGHFDHCGAALALAETWDVPIYAAADELPFVTGRADYAPKDPTAGNSLGFMSMASRVFPGGGTDLRPFVKPLPAESGAGLPDLPGWQWLPTPGHSPGQVAFFRERDGALIAGDAFTTTDLQSWTDLPLGVQEVNLPPLPFTPDWESARKSVRTLAALGSRLLACGHGLPMHGQEATRQLRSVAANFQPPEQGRYARTPARPVDDIGTIPLPPAPPDPLPLVAGALVAGVAAASWLAPRRRRD